MKAHGRLPGALLAIAAAGPLFVLGLWLGAVATQWPRPIAIEPGVLFTLLLIVPLSIIVGGMLGAVPIVLGSFAMSALGARHAAARAPLAWLAVGIAIGGGIAAYLLRDDSDLSGPIAFVLACGGCALLARIGVRWEAAHSPRSTRTPAVAISTCPPK